MSCPLVTIIEKCGAQGDLVKKGKIGICKMRSVGTDGQESKRDMGSSGIQARDADQGVTPMTR